MKYNLGIILSVKGWYLFLLHYVDLWSQCHSLYKTYYAWQENAAFGYICLKFRANLQFKAYMELRINNIIIEILE